MSKKYQIFAAVFAMALAHSTFASDFPLGPKVEAECQSAAQKAIEDCYTKTGLDFTTFAVKYDTSEGNGMEGGVPSFQFKIVGSLASTGYVSTLSVTVLVHSDGSIEIAGANSPAGVCGGGFGPGE